MANPQFIFNSITLDFPSTNLSAYQPNPRVVAGIHASGGSVIESVINEIFTEVVIGLSDFDDAAFFRALRAWWSWAQQGKQYAFAIDSTDKVDKLLDATAASGQKVIPITSPTSGIVTGNFYLLRSADRTKEEIIEVDTIETDISATAIANLIFSYSNGDTFRSIDYFPKVKSLDQTFPVRENAVQTYTLNHRFREDFGA